MFLIFHKTFSEYCYRVKSNPFEIGFEFVGNKTKGRISKRVFQENKARQIFWKTNISYPLKSTDTCGYQGVRNVRFSENLACFVFLKHPFWDSPFCLITNEFTVNLLKKNLRDYSFLGWFTDYFSQNKEIFSSILLCFLLFFVCMPYYETQICTGFTFR